MEQRQAHIVYRSVDMAGLRDIKNNPKYMHSGIKFANGKILAYYSDGRVREDSAHYKQYKIMSDTDTEKMFGGKNGFNDGAMNKALNVEKQTWDNQINKSALSYHSIAIKPFLKEHNCNDFTQAVVDRYRKNIGN